MHPEAIDYLHKQNIEALDNLYADLLRLARQGTPDAWDQLQDVIELRARITGDMQTYEEQQRQIHDLAEI